MIFLALLVIIIGETCIIWAVGNFAIFAFKINVAFTFLMALALDLVIILVKNIIKSIKNGGGK